MNQRSAEGDAHGYVGELIDPDWTPNDEPTAPYHPPVPEGMTAMPEPGIYFGMPAEDYHAVFALSSSGIKSLVSSPMLYWATSPMNTDYERPVAKWLNHGELTHCLVLEGEQAYHERYAVELDIEDFDTEGLLVSTDQIKAAIGTHTEEQPVKPEAGKQALIDQLDALGKRDGVSVDLEGTVTQLKERVRAFTEQAPVKPISRVEDTMDDGTEYTRVASKADWIAQLLELEPEARIWDHMTAQHLALHEGKTIITAADERRVRIAARMIEKNPDAGPLLKGGYPEVSIFWYCPITGVPMKARLDMLKLHAILDVKTFSNPQHMPVGKAIERAIANYRYNIQHVVYDQAVKAARHLVREQGRKAINIEKPTWYEHGDVDQCDEWQAEECDPLFDWAERWSKVEDPPKFIFIFQQSGIAPVTRVRGMPREEVFKATHRLIENMKFKWKECSETYGLDPWIDQEPMKDIEDEAIPIWSTEMDGYYD